MLALEALAETYRYELSSLGIDSIIVESGPFPSGLLTQSPSPVDKAVVDVRGDLGKVPEDLKAGFQSMYDSGEPPHTEDVSDAIVKPIERTSKRPLRTVVVPEGMDFGWNN